MRFARAAPFPRPRNPDNSQSYYGVLMRLHGLRNRTVQLCDLLIKQSQSLQLQREHLPVHGPNPGDKEAVEPAVNHL